jgi:membrane protease YdiL (CAAX protease family)
MEDGTDGAPGARILNPNTTLIASKTKMTPQSTTNLPARCDSEPPDLSQQNPPGKTGGWRTWLTNRWFLFACGLYLAGLGVLSRRPEFSLSDSIMELLIFGGGCSLLAWWATMRATPLEVRCHASGGEMIGLGVYLCCLSIYLAVGPQTIDSWLPADWLASDRIRFLVGLTRKLIVFVCLPFALFGPMLGHGWRDFGLTKAGLRELVRSHLPVVLVLSGGLLLFQYILGGGAAPLREGKFTSHQLLVGLPLCFLWLAVEAGLVEEFFFRALLQSRLSAWFRSEVTGIVLMALAFGLAHAPGFIFRHAGTVEGLGANPSALDAIAYSIVSLAISGVFFGIVWSRTRNLWAVVIIHAATDLLPNLQDFIRTWRI